MPDEFDDALDRLDVTFDDFIDAPDVRERLGEILGQRNPDTGRFAASDAQMAAVQPRVQLQRQQAFEHEVFVSRFMRGGEQVTQLRDARGRFVAAGGRGIREYLARPPY